MYLRIRFYCFIHIFHLVDGSFYFVVRFYLILIFFFIYVSSCLHLTHVNHDIYLYDVCRRIVVISVEIKKKRCDDEFMV